MAHDLSSESSMLLTEPARLAQLTREAAASPRKRSHLLFHSGHDDQVQRLLIAAQPGTYIRPHVHSEQWEMLVLVAGCLDVLTFDGRAVTSWSRLERVSPVVQIPMGTWHSCVVRVPDTLVLEVKPGPYRPNEFASWAPDEGTADAESLLGRMSDARPGDSV